MKNIGDHVKILRGNVQFAAFHLVRTHLGGGGGARGSGLPYISIVYYMQKGEEGVQIIVYVLNVGPLFRKKVTGTGQQQQRSGCHLSPKKRNHL